MVSGTPGDEPGGPGTATADVRSTTSDGTTVIVRPVGPADADLLVRGFERLSDDSRYSRFFSPTPELDVELVRRFTDPDQVDHLALGALLPDDVEPEGVAVARAFRSPAQRDEAEFAVAVVDEWHGHGIGSLLVDRLGVACLAASIRTLTAEILTTNLAMLSIVRARDGEIERDARSASVSIARLSAAVLAERVPAGERAALERRIAAVAGRATS